ncbi:MAG: type II toxin-antitoxin system VapC family toxin [Candidatus Baltobacteraceae bacterium]
MTIASKTRTDLPGPLYLDASALVKLYLPEFDSPVLNRLLLGRRDALISDLGVTEVVSSLARRCREGGIQREAVLRLRRELLRNIEAGVYRRVELVPDVYRDSERLLLSLGNVAIRAADALHLALAVSGGAATVCTYDRRLTEATKAIGLHAYP